MRTTLDIDDRVLAVAKARAQANRTSAGREVSKLALLALDNENAQTTTTTGRFLVAPHVPGHVLTTEMVVDCLDD